MLLAISPLILAQQGRLVGILIKPENILFVGGKSLSSEDLRSVFRSAGTVTAQLKSDSMDIYNGDRIAHGLNMIVAIYHNRGFVKATVTGPEIDLAEGGSDAKVQMIVNITENHAYRLRQIRIQGAGTLGEALLISMLNVKPDSPLNLSKINSGALAIREAYLTLGYLDVEVKPALDTSDGKRVADLSVTITEGKQYHVGKLTLVGSPPIRESLLREFLPLQSGDIFGQKAFDSCLQSLNELGITPVLTASDVTFNYDRGRALVDLEINLVGKAKN